MNEFSEKDNKIRKVLKDLDISHIDALIAVSYAYLSLASIIQRKKVDLTNCGAYWEHQNPVSLTEVILLANEIALPIAEIER